MPLANVFVEAVAALAAVAPAQTPSPVVIINEYVVNRIAPRHEVEDRLRQMDQWADSMRQAEAERVRQEKIDERRGSR